MAHDQPTYASVPGIRVFGMMCVKPGVKVRRPSQPPQRYQNQNSNKYYSQSTTTTARPSFHQTHQSQYQANYQYLNRPVSSQATITSTKVNGVKISQFGQQSSGYGRSNLENQEEVAAEVKVLVKENGEELKSRQARSIEDIEESDEPEFPWDRIKELQESLQWN